MEDIHSGVGRVLQNENIEVAQNPVALERKYVGKLKKGATTPNVANIENWDCINTVAVSVTDFKSGQDGQNLFLQGDGFTTLVFGTKIKTNTGVDKLLLVNRLYHLQRRAGVWIEH